MRTERLKIVAKINKQQYEKYREEVAKFLDCSLTMVEGDHIDLRYLFFAEYDSQIVPRFEALIKILNDPEIEVTASLEELKGMQCLFAELILALERRKECPITSANG